MSKTLKMPKCLPDCQMIWAQGKVSLKPLKNLGLMLWCCFSFLTEDQWVWPVTLLPSSPPFSNYSLTKILRMVQWFGLQGRVSSPAKELGCPRFHCHPLESTGLEDYSGADTLFYHKANKLTMSAIPILNSSIKKQNQKNSKQNPV